MSKKLKLFAYPGKKSNKGNCSSSRINEASVRQFLTKYMQTASKEVRTYAGKSRILNALDENHCEQRRITDWFQSASKLKEGQINIINKTCSSIAVRRQFNDMEFYACQPEKKRLLTKIMRSTRLEWCNNLTNLTFLDWKKVIFSDKSRFNLIGAYGII